jgi:hypothetical protein
MNKIILGFFQAKNKTISKGLLFLFTSLLMTTQASLGQTTIFNYQNSTATIPSGFLLNDIVTTNLIDRMTFLLVDAGTVSDNIVTPNYDLSSYASLSLNVNVATFGTGTNNSMKIEFSIDGGANWESTTYTTATPSSSIYIAGGPVIITQTFSSTTRFRFSNNGNSGRGVRIQSLSLTGTSSSSGPEINIKGNSNSIIDGATLTSTGNGTNYGTNATNTTVNKIFTIENTGSNDLILTSPFVKKSLGSTEFTITQPLLTTIPAGNSTTFSVAFNSATPGTFNENIEVLSNDIDEGVYNFAIKAVAKAPEPNIIIKGNNIKIVSGDSTPDALDQTDFGTSIINTSLSKSFIIENMGTGPLTISNIVMNSGSAYSISGIVLPATIPASGSTSFTVTFNSLVAGNFTDTVIITNDDSTDSSFTFAVTAKAVALNFGVGDISITGLANDTPDAISFVNWKPIPIDAELSFTDNAWNGTALLTNEDTMVWKNNTGAVIAIGTVILINDSPLTDLGTIIAGDLNGLSSSGENLLVYEGSSINPHFIYGLSNLPWITEGVVNTSNSYLPAALNSSNGNIATGNIDNVEYSGNLAPKNEKSSFTAYKTLVNDPANWTKNNTYFALNSIDFELAAVWENASWTDGLTPTVSINTIINDTYSTTSNGTFTTKKLVVNTGKSLTINSGKNLFIQNEIINNGTVTIENNANLIQVNNTANTGEITFNRSGAALMLLDYSLWSSPVSGQKLKAFSPNTLDNRFYTYNPTTNIYVPVDAPATTDFALGSGYLIRVPNDHPTTPTIWNGIFKGVPNNGNVTITGLSSGTFNAVGNPYPSTVSADAFITANNLTEPLYFWRKTNAAAGTAYATYTMAGAVGTPGNGGIIPNGTIQVGQGFIVKTTSNAVAFTNAMRTANTANQILRTATTEKNRIWLNLSKGTEPVNQMMIAYMDGATSEIDNALDGRYINDNETALTNFLKAEEFVIQAKGLPFDSSDIVPLSFKTELAGSFSIDLDHVDGLFLGNQEIVLKDLKAGTEQNLKKGSYSFTSEAGTFTNRFEIAFKNSQTLDISTPIFDENSVIVFNQNGMLNVFTGENAIKNIRVFDIRGVLIAEQKDVNANKASLKNVTASTQAVLIQITSNENKTVIKKAIF